MEKPKGDLTKKKRIKECEICFSTFIYFRKDGSYFCRKCGYDSLKGDGN